MRITFYKDKETLTLKLEGSLTGSWVEEFKSCWQAANDIKNVQRISLDLSEITFVDDEGKQALALMHQAGSEISVTNILTGYIAEEIRKQADQTTA